MDVVGVMGAYLPVLRVCTAQSREALSASLDCAVHTRTDYVHVNGHDRTITVILAKHRIKLPDDGSLVIRNMLSQV